MSIIDKSKVNQNFSRGAKTYDKYAVIQQHMADKLEIFVHGSKKTHEILEIGCGTGFFSKKLVRRFPSSNIDLLDISQAMLDTAMEKLGENSNVSFIKEDIEKYSPGKKYDLIFSNATFQWINDLKGLLEHLYSMLDHGGVIVFSTFGYKTYFELRESLKALDSDLVYSQNFFKISEIRAMVENKCRILAADEEYMVENYSNVTEFLKAIKGIGSNSALATKKSFTKEKFKALDNIYREKYGDENKINVTNDLIYMVLEKIR